MQSIPAFGRLGHENHKFETSMSYIARPFPLKNENKKQINRAAKDVKKSELINNINEIIN